MAYDAGTGTERWVSRYNTGVGFDRPAAIAVDRLGRVYVTGGAQMQAAINVDYATVAYDTDTGTQQWEAQYNGTGHGIDRAAGIAVDGLGGVYVTGASGDANHFGYATVAYDSATGNRQWVAQYDGPVNGGGRAAAIAVNGRGSVYVTGYSYTLGIGTVTFNYATVAYAADTGDEQWVEQYVGPAGGNDLASAIAVDAFGTVYVTGGSSRDSTGSDYATVAYSPGSPLPARAGPRSIGTVPD